MIDAHLHVWRLAAPEREWPGPDLPVIHRDFSLNDFWAAAEPLGVTGGILVQSQPDERDTEWLLSIARDDTRIAGVVGWTDLLAPDAPARIAELAERPKLVGLRPMLQGLEPDWISNPALDPAITAMIENGLTFDALVKPPHLPALRDFARRWPDLPIVIDHAGKPDIVTGDLTGWLDTIEPLARLPNIHCKLSGLLTEMGPSQTIDALDPFFDGLFRLFGPSRLMWGSDWPVINLAGDYAGWLTTARRAAAERAPQSGAAIFGETALTFYGD